MAGDDTAKPIDAALQRLRAAAEIAKTTATVQGAMGWLWRGDIEKARAALRKLPPDRLLEVSAAAAALGALADEIAAQ